MELLASAGMNGYGQEGINVYAVNLPGCTMLFDLANLLALGTSSFVGLRDDSVGNREEAEAFIQVL